MKKPLILIDLDGVLNNYRGDFKELQRAITNFKPHWKLKQNNNNRA